MILHQFPPLFAQTDRPLQTTIVMIILKLPINITIHLIITFILHQIQLPIQISNQNHPQIKTTSTTQNPFIQLSHTNTSQNIYSQNQGTSYPSTSYSNITQASQRRLNNLALTHIPTDPLYQMHPNPNPNPNPNPLPPNTIQHIPPQLTQQLAPPPQYLQMPQDNL